MATTRSNTTVYLVHSTLNELKGSRLPTRGQALRLFLHLHLELKHEKKPLAAKVIDESRQPTGRATKLIRLYNEWVSLKKSKSKRGPTRWRGRRGIRRIPASPLRHRAPRCAYTPHRGRGPVIPAGPKGGRARGSLGSRDMSLAVKEKKVKEKLESTNRRRAEAEAKVCLELDRSVVLSGSSSAGSSSDSSASAGKKSYPAVAACTRRERLQ
ncbi:hypothetical protein GWK47_037957 [Chionoecetes opilio]|uniref:Uncharacterized protein n=1 Tax=Chionoecetes opilio TaxID=41210 RepID=A0A8J5D230_CHIOP|nr:hypothetical protein GWK47_037957 [Chionoecetes opilio]